MKKILVLLLAAAMALSVVACGEKKEGNETDSDKNVSQITDSLEVLTKVWGTYEESEFFPVAGGDSANANWEGPAKFDISAKEELEANYGVSANLAGQIDDAATMMHAMMADNFAVGVYHITDMANVESFAANLKTDLLAKQWLCGQPEKVLVMVVDDYVIAGYGQVALLDTFKSKLMSEYTGAIVLYEENIG